MIKNRTNNFAFTLAEVLITLGVIGIVAAMTIPALMNNINNAQYKSAWKKEYSAITQAIYQIYADEGVSYNSVDYPTWEYMPRYFCKLQKRLKFLSSGINCPENEDEIPAVKASWPITGKVYWHADNNWKTKNGNLLEANSGYNNMSAILADGAIIQFTCTSQIFIDVNGYKGPNTVGEDIFYFRLSTNKDIPNKTSFWTLVNGCRAADSTNIDASNYVTDCESGTGWGCSASYLENSK